MFLSKAYAGLKTHDNYNNDAEFIGYFLSKDNIYIGHTVLRVVCIYQPSFKKSFLIDFLATSASKLTSLHLGQNLGWKYLEYNLLLLASSLFAEVSFSTFYSGLTHIFNYN